MATCKSCGAPIVWVKTPAGKWLPCDEGLLAYKQDDEAGGDTVVTDDGEVIRCHLHFDGFATGMARMPHWATCSEPDRFRRRAGYGS